MIDSPKKKICLVSLALGGGGAEKSVALLSKLLTNMGHDVHIVTVVNKIEYEYSGQLLNLGLIKDQYPGLIGSIKRLMTLKRYLKKQDFNVVIDNRTRVVFFKELIISKWLYNPKKTIYVVRSYHMSNYLPDNPMFARFLYGDAFKIIGVSNMIANKLREKYKLKNAVRIYNPVEFQESAVTSHQADQDYIIFFGRLEEKVKNISLLIKAFELSNLSSSNVRLVIMGEGPDKAFLQDLAAKSSVSEYIDFKVFNSNPTEFVSSARFSVLSSHYEGFPRMILESLSLGVPVISVDCESGPKEIIDHKVNGLLIKNYDEKALAQAMDNLFYDEGLYQVCKENSIKSVKKFNFKAISRDWQQLLT